MPFDLHRPLVAGRPSRRFPRRSGAALIVAAAIVLVAVACGRASAAGAPQPDPTRGHAPRAAARRSATTFPFTPAERVAVDDFLRRNPSLRAATDEDRRKGSDADTEVRGLYGIYHPYFVRGDLDDDGVLDFVLGFVRRDSSRGSPAFTIVVFTGKPGGSTAPGFSAGTVIERDVPLSRGDLAVDRDAVVITPDLDEDAVRRYRWDPAQKTFVFVPDDEDGPAPPEVSRTAARGLRPPFRRAPEQI